MKMDDWAVYRQDFTGNDFLVEKGLSEQKARDLVLVYESHKHHQHYWADRQPDERPDYPEMLTRMLRAGSSIALSLPVLRGQGATESDCVAAIEIACGKSAKESAEMIKGSL